MLLLPLGYRFTKSFPRDVTQGQGVPQKKMLHVSDVHHFQAFCVSGGDKGRLGTVVRGQGRRSVVWNGLNAHPRWCLAEKTRLDALVSGLGAEKAVACGPLYPLFPSGRWSEEQRLRHPSVRQANS